jgi:(1->4)-alpha-D-glucan 1-alpha-D-glucosylmutase
MVGSVVSKRMKSNSHIPRATYRLQLNHDFNFAQATAIVPYLAQLGISHVYLSPVLKARPGSMHGYDIVDHNSFNPEIGSAEDFDALVYALHRYDMGIIADIVPNHMGVMGSDNAWWLDVLENGESSAFAEFFDIDWQPLKDELRGKVLVPVLHDHYGTVLESGELKLVFECSRGEFCLVYHEHRFPIDPKEYPRILLRCSGALSSKLGEQNTDFLEFQSLITALGHLPARYEIASDRIAERNRDKEIHKHRLAELCMRCPEIAECITPAVDAINGVRQNPASFEDLHELIKAQAFRLANWRVAADDINYRRFFDTNDLAGVRMESEKVFETTHRLILKLMADGKVDGLRIDHPDGLYDPARYFERLRESIVSVTKDSESNPPYVVIEKILAGSEQLPEKWEVSGTTGYDFSNLVNGLFVDSASVMRLERIYRNFSGEKVYFGDLAYRSRQLIMRVALASELNLLANQLARIALSKRHTCDFTLNSLRDALSEVVASFPVYRTYVSKGGTSERDEHYIRLAIASAKWRSPAADISIFDFIGGVLLTSIAEGQDSAYRDAVVRFAMKFQQFSSPVMAKGIEDTAFYRYNRLVSLNEVGSDLYRFGVTSAEFHSANRERIRTWPHSMLNTSTHDSKRSEDMRARINVLSEISGPWRLRTRDWRRINRSRKRMVNDHPAPSANDEYLVYQTLVGACPFGLADEGQSESWHSFSERIEKYMLKALREAKENTSWINPNTEYESAAVAFVKRLLAPSEKNKFLADFLPFQKQVARIGRWNSLSQTLLKLTCPGVPDVYQGNELWDFSLVDPDNRRPVDYSLRRKMLECVQSRSSELDSEFLRVLMETPDDGRLKLYLIWKVLDFRRKNPDVFQMGGYLPLMVGGAKADHAVAFARTYENKSVVVIAPRMIASLLGNDLDVAPVGEQVWKDTYIELPSLGRTGQYQNLLSGEKIEMNGRADFARVLGDFPVGLLHCEVGLAGGGTP